MAAGKSSYFDLDSNKTDFKVRVNWSETYDAGTNTSVVTVTSVQFKSTSLEGFTYYPDGLVKINGQTVMTMSSYNGTHYCTSDAVNTWCSIKIGDSHVVETGSTTVVHDEDGKKSITIELTADGDGRFYFYSAVNSSNQTGGAPWYVSGSSEVALTDIPTYTLAISAGSGSTITVSRTSSGYSGASIGNIATRTILYYGDKLKITFRPKTNYRLLTTTVNGVAFTSGNTHTVAADVTVMSTAQVLASKVGATDANIGSTSTITVTKYNTSYYHSLQYEFGDLSGYITSSGGVQSTETKFQGESIAFTVPTSFYAQIPNRKTGVCTITCRTYSTSSSTTVLGTATTCTFTATAYSGNCSPTVSATVIDTNATTKALTGNENTLIRYCSKAKCTITATARCSATITSLSIAGTSVQPGTVSLTLSNTDKTSFDFSATDSRGYTASKTINPTVVSYVVLTCNPTVARPTPTGSTMTINITGNVFRGSFGAYSNTLTLQYRYRESGGSYSSWKTIDSAKVVFGTSSYRTNGAITLNDEFDYQKAYDFQIKATDGANGVVLTTAQQTVTVQKGVPVFDWCESDFNVNADIRMFNISLLDIIYPVGSVFLSSSSTLPSSLTTGDMNWISISKIGNAYCWKRTS